MCYWFEKDGASYLAKQTAPNDRCLGLGDTGYASWALQQVRNMGYFTNVIHNPDGTLSPGVNPGTYLAGPYLKWGINWVWWAPKGHADILVCELEMGSAPIWQNWSGNIKHMPAADGENYYFTPNNLVQLQTVLADAKRKGVTIRVSGQRHSQSPLVADDNRNNPPQKSKSFIVDMSCYIDVGTTGMALGPGTNQVTVNPGIREDAVDAFLTQHNLMFKTVTAGGFFSLGGMTAVDVHGGTVDGPIFAETASSFTILGADGKLTTIDKTSPSVNGWSPLQFARVSLGGLGIVTRMTIDVLPRPYATTLKGETKRYLLKNKDMFIGEFQKLLTGPSKYDRMEAFYSPYAAAPNMPVGALPNFLLLGYNTVGNPEPKTRNSSPDPQTACTLAGGGNFGAPMLGGLAGYAAQFVRDSQYYSNPYNPLHVPPVPTAGFAAIALDEIESQAAAANEIHSDLWLAESSQVMFMSYFIELPALDSAGLSKVWDGLDVVARRVIQDDSFHIAAPMEFRFVKAGNTAMSGSYSKNPDAYFVNLDLIGFIEPTPSADYPAKMLQFFADVEREWVAMGGIPHNGKMYGFYDPTQAAGTYTAAFNPNFLAALRKLRGERLKAFSSFRRAQDPTGLFYNGFLRQVLDD
jgi:FAD/FMN-containing dehydrogenase